VAIARTDATPALELAAAAPLVAHQFVDHPSGDAGDFQPGREGVAQIMMAMGIDRSKVMACAGDRALVDAAEVVPGQRRARARRDPVAAARAGETRTSGSASGGSWRRIASTTKGARGTWRMPASLLGRGLKPLPNRPAW
jgi:hypothetical protein